MTLWQRDGAACVQCPSSTPRCDCKKNEQCSLIPQSCTQCARMVCIADSSSSTAGPIAGGVIGGLAALGLLIGIYIWWRRRRMRMNMGFEPGMSAIMDKGMRDTHYSIDSVNTTQDRGSNVIPIAYIPGVTAISENQGQVRGSVATSDYRASLPDFVMAVHGQPSLVEIGALKRKGSGNSQYLPQGEDHTQASSIYDELKLDDLTAPFGIDAFEAAANSGKSMVTIPEDPEEDNVTTSYRSMSGASRPRPPAKPYPLRQSSIRRDNSRNTNSARYSRNSSVREYNMNLPEEAYLYYNNLGPTEE